MAELLFSLFRKFQRVPSWCERDLRNEELERVPGQAFRQYVQKTGLTKEGAITFLGLNGNSYGYYLKAFEDLARVSPDCVPVVDIGISTLDSLLAALPSDLEPVIVYVTVSKQRTLKQRILSRAEKNGQVVGSAEIRARLQMFKDGKADSEERAKRGQLHILLNDSLAEVTFCKLRQILGSLLETK